MCGICGLIGRVDHDTITAMNQTMVHRGPDDGDVTLFPAADVALGHRRLSIIDLSPQSRQPFRDPDGLAWITYNGEIYNYRELRDELAGRGVQFRTESDTEVLLQAYLTWGTDCLQRLNGMFAFAIFDTRNRQLFMARDRLGIKPLYYAAYNDRFAFASEFKALLTLSDLPRDVDLHSLYGAAMLGWTPAPASPFQAIRKLPPGCFMLWQAGRSQITRYWSIEPAAAADAEAPDARLAPLLADAVRLQMIADVPVGAFLSGGLDSSLVVAHMRRLSSGPIHTYTIRFPDADQQQEKMPDDSRYARQVADHFQTDHRELVIQPNVVDLLPKLIHHNEEMITDPAAINTYLIADAARQAGTTVLLNGMGGDEVFGGYRKQLAAVLARRYRRAVPSGLRRGLIEPLAARLPVAGASGGYRLFRWAQRFFNSASADDFACFQSMGGYYHGAELGQLFATEFPFSHAEAAAVATQRQLFDRFADCDYVTRLCLLDTSFFLPDWNLHYSDKAAMAASIESRPPLLDHRVVELAFQVAGRYKIRGRKQKWMLKEAARDLLPANIIDRPKAPFGSPLRSWMKGALADMVDDILSPRALRERGLMNPDFVRRLIHENRRGEKDHAHRLWNLLNLEMWHRHFVDGTP